MTGASAAGYKVHMDRKLIGLHGWARSQAPPLPGIAIYSALYCWFLVD